MSTKMRFIVIKYCCSLCNKEYSSPRNLRDHYLNKCETTIRNVQYQNGVKRKLPDDVVVVDRTNVSEDLQYTTEFACPGCYELFKDLDTLNSHVTIEHGQDEEATFTQDEAFTNFREVSKISAESVPTDTEVAVSLNHAIKSLYPEHSNTNNQMVTNIITSLNLAPFIMNSDCTDNSKLEVTALTTPSQHKRILDVKTKGIKRVKLDTPVENAVNQSTDCIHLRKISNDISFNEIIGKSTYRQMLAFEEYGHITEEHLDLLNSHWRKRSFMYMVTAQLLAGAILVDGSQALLLNGVESYSRYPSIDAHFEEVSSTQESSIPQVSSQYSNKLKITKINMDNLEKLILGSKTMNILVISSIRIDDSKLAPEVGPSTNNFTPSSNTRIFVSTSSIQLANKILQDPNSLTLSDPLVHLRQLRTEFHQRSTYSLARSYSVFTSDVTVQPYTIYTLVNSTANNKTGCIMGSKVMELIGNSVFEGNGMLKKEDIKQLLPKECAKETQVVSDTLSITDLFKDDCELEIIANTSVSPFLRSIAISTTDGLKSANTDIIKNIWNRFLQG